MNSRAQKWGVCLRLALFAFTVIPEALPVRGVAAGAIQATYYVDPANGNDSADGTAASSSFRTITKARDTVRRLCAQMSGDIVVYLRGGTYFIDSTIAFDAADSGSQGFSVIYNAYRHERPVISGGKRIIGWTLADPAKNIYQAAVDPALDFRQIYVGGQRAIRARTPNLTDSATLGPRLKAISTDPFTVGASEISAWSNLNQVECVWVAHWKDRRARIASFTTNGPRAILTFMEPEGSAAGQRAMRHFPQANTYFFFENAYEFLDAEGEWYLNSRTHELFYKPRADEDMNRVEVIVPVVETLVSVTGTPSNFVHNIQFREITFEHSNWAKPNDVGYLTAQGGTKVGPSNWVFVPGMVMVDYARELKFEHNVFRRSGAHALVLMHKTAHNQIVGSLFTDLASGGIYVDLANVSGGSVSDAIENNLIDGVGQVYADALPIVACNVAGIAIRHNTIRNCPYGAISVGWSWRDVDLGCHDNEIAYNHISHYLQLLDDSAGIYTLGMMKGGVVHDNYIAHLQPSPYEGGNPMAGIYQDNGSCFVTVRDNVLDQTGSAFYAFNLPNHDNSYSNNYYNIPFAKRGMRTNNLITNNVAIAGQNWPPQARRIMQAAGLEPAYADLLAEQMVKHQ
jgi:hypothetical protein